MKSTSLDTDQYESLAYVNQVVDRLEDLVQSIAWYVRAYPQDAPIGFLGLFFESYQRLVRSARRPSGDRVGDLKANARTALASLHLIARSPDCAEEAFKLLSGSDAAVPNYLSLRLDLASPTPQEQAWAVTGIYDRFWGHFVYSDVESPVSAGGGVSLRSYLVESGLTGE